jgi:hypothetical protein
LTEFDRNGLHNLPIASAPAAFCGVAPDFDRHYLLPFIDVGTEIGVGAGTVDACTARTSYVSSDGPCLVCSGVVDVSALAEESMAPEERERIASLQYGAPLEQAAVMDLNARAASFGALVLRHLVQPMLREPLHVHILESLLTCSMNPDRGRARASGCFVCGTGATMGRGDRGEVSTRPRADGPAATWLPG